MQILNWHCFLSFIAFQTCTAFFFTQNTKHFRRFCIVLINVIKEWGQSISKMIKSIFKVIHPRQQPVSSQIRPTSGPQGFHVGRIWANTMLLSEIWLMHNISHLLKLYYNFLWSTDQNLSHSLAAFPLQICAKRLRYFINVNKKMFCQMTAFPLTDVIRLKHIFFFPR